MKIENIGRKAGFVALVAVVSFCMAISYVVFDGFIYRKRPAVYRTNVYDLRWIEETKNGDRISHKWRCHLNAGGFTPIIIEKFSGSPGGTPVREGRLLIDCFPADIEKAFKDAGF